MAITERETSVAHETLKPIFEIHSFGLGEVMETDTSKLLVYILLGEKSNNEFYVCLYNTSLIGNWKHMLDSFYANVGALKLFFMHAGWGGPMRMIRALQKANSAPTHEYCEAHMSLITLFIAPGIITKLIIISLAINRLLWSEVGEVRRVEMNLFSCRTLFK